jgi:hypothetical protein
VSFEPTLLEDSLDPWLAIEPDRHRRELVVRFLMALCDAEGVWPDAVPVVGTSLPAFAVSVPGAAVVVVWVIAGAHPQLAFRYLYDIATGQRFGG